MKHLEQLVLRIADSDWAWRGFNWMRPAKHQRIGVGYILLSSLFLSLPGIAVGAALLSWLRQERVEAKAWLTLFALAMAVALSLHALFAHYWNRRATSLAKTKSLN